MFIKVSLSFINHETLSSIEAGLSHHDDFNQGLPEAFNPEPYTQKPQPSTLNPKPLNPSSKPQIPNPRSQTPSSKPQTQHPNQGVILNKGRGVSGLDVM